MKHITNRPLPDMETDGVYFNQNDRVEIKKVVVEDEVARKEDICQYSGLRSLSFYQNIDNED